MTETGTLFERACEYARKLGEEEGRNAAAWWEQDAIGGRVTSGEEETATRVLQGLEDGDPEILDALPFPDLSGEWAERMTGPELVTQALESVGLVGGDPSHLLEWDNEICDAYELAFSQAAQDAITEACRSVLSE